MGRAHTVCRRGCGGQPGAGHAACGRVARDVASAALTVVSIRVSVSYTRTARRTERRVQMRQRRVLGVDPGLTRCGVGVVEGVPGRPCTMVDYTVIGSDPDADLADRLLHLDRELALLIAEAPAGERRRGAGVQPAQRPYGDGHRPGGAVAMLAARAPGCRCALHSQRGQGRRDRLRAGRQGAGHGDGHPLLRLAPRPGRRTPPTRSRWRSATSGAVARATGWRGRPAREGQAVMIASVAGTGRLHRPRTRPSSRSAVSGMQCMRAGHAAGLRVGQGPAVRHAGRARGLADPVRLRRRRREAALRAAADGQRGRPEAGPAVLAVHTPGRPAPALRSGRPGADPVPGIGKKGAERMVLELGTGSAP